MGNPWESTTKLGSEKWSQRQCHHMEPWCDPRLRGFCPWHVHRLVAVHLMVALPHPQYTSAITAMTAMKSWPKEIHFYRYVYSNSCIYIYIIWILYIDDIDDIDRTGQNCPGDNSDVLWVASMWVYWGIPVAIRASRSIMPCACACRIELLVNPEEQALVSYGGSPQIGIPGPWAHPKMDGFFHGQIPPRNGWWLGVPPWPWKPPNDNLLLKS